MEPTNRYTVDICVTHACNLSCRYCYQNHSNHYRMTFEKCKKCIDYSFSHIPNGFDSIEFDFIGGEPLLEFELLKKITEYVKQKNSLIPYILFATTNGTLLTEDMKQWFFLHKDIFWLGLSVDGIRAVHNYNRSDSFDKIDFKFFLTTWPDQYAKMTLSEYSLYYLAESIPFVYSLGFKHITGVNLAEGNFNWDNDELIKKFIKQLEKLECFYLNNPQYKEHLFEKEIAQCAATERPIRKWCGIGEGMIFFDYDGTQYPCPYCTPMTFSKLELRNIQRTDFHNPSEFLDKDCFDNCYIYPICSTCAGSNYQMHHTFKKRAKNKCRIQKLLALFSADYWAKKITSQMHELSDTQIYYTIEAIKVIRTLYLPEFAQFFE